MAITVGSVEVDIVPNTRGIYAQLKAGLQEPAAKAGEDAGQVAGRRFNRSMAAAAGQGIGTTIGEQIGRQIAGALSREVSGAVQDGIQLGGRRAAGSAGRAGDDTAGAFARAMRARLEAAFRAMPRLDIRVGDTGVDVELARLRARLETLSNKRIGIDVDAGRAAAEVAAIEAQLVDLAGDHPNVAVRADAATALAQLRLVREEIDRLSADPARVRIETDGDFGARMRAAVAAAQASLPEINVGADTDPARARIQELRGQLASLANARVGIDIDAGAALAQIATVRTALAEIAASRATVDVRVDAARAVAELAAVQAQADALDGGHEIRIETGSAMSSLIALGVQLGILAGIQAGPIIAAGIGAIGAAALSAAVGVGALVAVALPAIGGIKNALTLQKQAQEASTQATRNGAAAAAQSQQRVLQMAGAQQALAAAHRNAAREISAAQQGIADAVQASADHQQQAARQVAAAELSLAQAQRSAGQAQLDLVAARKTAEDQLLDLNNQLADSQLSQRDAVLQVQQAEIELRRVQANRSASKLQQDQAQLAYEQAVQHLSEQQTATERLQAKTEEANKAGVEGSQTYLDAQDKVAQTQQDVQDRTQALADAQHAAAVQQIADSRAVAEAQAKLVQAQQQAADSITSAQRQIAAAQLSTAASADSAAAAQHKYEQALAGLSPTARTLMSAYQRLKTAFTGWSTSLQPRVLPLFTRLVDGAAGSLGKLTPLVLGTADAIGELEDRAGRQLKTPFWQTFYQDLTTSVGPAVVGLGVTFGNIFKGMAGVLGAFLPHMDGVSSTLERITGRFANWGASLRGSPEFERFLDYAARTAPQLSQALGKIADAFFDVSRAIAPIAGPALAAVGMLADLIGAVAEHAPWAIAGLYGIAIASKAAAIAAGIFNGALAVYNAIVAIATAETITWDAALQATGIVPLIELIIVAIAALVVGVIYAYDHFEWFGAAVDATWHAIADGATWLWQSVLQPTFAAIWAGLQLLGAAAMWLWTNAIKPAFGFIWDAARVLLAVVAVVVIAPLIIAFHLLADAAMWLWRDVLKPVFGWIADGATWLWENVISPQIDAWVGAFKVLGAAGMWLWSNALKPTFQAIGDGATWLWRNAIKPAFDGIGAAASWLYDHVLKPVFDRTVEALQPVGDAFGAARDFIAKAWGDLYDITKKPINFLIQSVYTDGIKAVWDRVADFVHLPHLPDAPKLLAAGGTVGPGWGPAVPMVTNRPTAIVGEGNPRYPEYVIPTDPRFRGRSLALLQAAGSQLLAGGGVLGGLWDSVKGVAGTAWSWAKDGADLIAHPAKAWEAVTAPVRDLIAKIGDSAMAKTVAGIPIKALGGLKDRLLDFVGIGGGSSSGGVGSGVQRWSDVVLQALAMVGQPAGLLGTTLRRMNQESGGNPTIVNTTDSNWQAGTPSVGLMQVIGPTFRAYAGALADRGPFSYGVSTDPLANVYASMRYALSQYGSLSAAYDRPGGYDSGGYLPTGLSTVYNGTGKPEPVFTSQQWDAIQRGGGPGGKEVTVPVYYSAPTPEDPQKAALEIGRRVAAAVSI
ncbi:hypothetical protein [Kitasatospora phosalacinea]|uniref:Transglycosylase SLT domain-containing protein n=1 Tax=Kitasatospora phosalacinea TaxID=2065 RepID=A0ABW6GRH0_9ACTN